MKYYLEEAGTVLKQLESDINGLSSQQAEARLAQNGPNELREAKKIPLWRRFLRQMADPMIIILLIAAVVSTVTEAISSSGAFFPTDAVIILAVVILNAALGVFQESKAEKAIEALKQMTAATSKVVRDGRLTTVHSSELVRGDIIHLEAGDAVPADARIIESASLKLEEAALTGESVPVSKYVDLLNLNESDDIPLGDRKNMVYTGSTVAYGRGVAVVTETGMKTEMGKIADALDNASDSKTPLQQKLAELSKALSFIVLGICVFIFILRIVTNLGAIDFSFALDSFMIAVSLAVAAIPEGLVAVVTAVLSIGVTKMSKKNAVIRKLTAVETLGCAQIICSDKTGTLTQNKMTVVETYGTEKQLLARAMALCSDAELDRETEKAVGEPTECALVNFAFSEGLDKNELKQQAPRIAEAPFDSVRKMMSTVHDESGKVIQYTKGAPDEILKRCTQCIIDGKAVELDQRLRENILGQNKVMADKALRTLAAAMRVYKELPEDTQPEGLEQDLVFIGLCGMIDPVRDEVRDAISECRQAGIRPIMITGDHRDTAVAIAMNLGIIQSPDEAITGAELDKISEEDFLQAVQKYSVYARVQPEHKVRIVKAWQQNGYVTAMTGDGVNDAPSIKSADIGIGMGITGTDVTKNVADMVLADDNFATIVGAVGEGRRIYDNIRKAIQFLLGSNLSEVLSILAATIMNFTILKPVHLLWINLATDCFPALSLGVEEAEDDIMKRAPRKTSDGIFSGGVGFNVLYQGVLVTLVTLTAYFIGARIETGSWAVVNSGHGMTMAFLTMSMGEIFQSFNSRSINGSSVKLLLSGKHNKLLFAAMASSLVLTTAVIYIPFLKNAFEFTAIGAGEYFIALGLAFSVVPAVELIKYLKGRKGKKTIT